MKSKAAAAVGQGGYVDSVQIPPDGAETVLEDGVMQSSTLIDVLTAAHYTAYVSAEQFRCRGGMMLMGPAESLKTTFVRLLEEHGALCVPDLTQKSLMTLRDDFINGRYRTIVIDDFAKIYKRREETASGFVGCIQSMVEEGMSRAHWESSTAPGARATCLFVAAMTSSFALSRWNQWASGGDQGLLRRFLWCTVQLEDPRLLLESVHNWQRITLSTHGMFRIPVGTPIPHTTTRDESKFLEQMLRPQNAMGAGGQTPLALMNKILDVLKWVYKRNGKPDDLALRVMADFAKCLSSEGAKVRLT